MNIERTLKINRKNCANDGLHRRAKHHVGMVGLGFF